MTLYFAYGNNLDPGKMLERCFNEATGRSNAALKGYRFLINTDGVSTIIKDADAVTEGYTWEISVECERKLDFCEGVKSGVYIKKYLPVELNDGTKDIALIYIANNKLPGGRSKENGEYLERIIRNARRLSLSETYLKYLEGLRV